MNPFQYRTLTMDGPIKEFKLLRMARGGWRLTSEEQPRNNIYIYHFRRVRAAMLPICNIPDHAPSGQ